ncbi:hypothetical protein BC826DRAFT_54321 [Russula brevipes]|nr:hypothetical protein BC826DRAFT_54321 [Russula brevipes]
MICFDFDGKIKKYNSPEEIIDEFYSKAPGILPEAQGLPRERTTSAIREAVGPGPLCQDDHQQGAGGVQPQKGGHRRRIAREGILAFPQGDKAKAAGDTEDVEDNDEAEVETGASTDYDYLLSMAIWSLTKERIEKLLQQASDKEKELSALLELTPVQIWNSDLGRFLEEWEKDCQEWDNKAMFDSSGKVQ